jgi:hypothetical protein
MAALENLHAHLAVRVNTTRNVDIRTDVVADASDRNLQAEAIAAAACAVN